MLKQIFYKLSQKHEQIKMAYKSQMLLFEANIYAKSSQIYYYIISSFSLAYKMKRFVYLLAFILLISAETFESFKAQMEERVMGLATKMESIFADRCIDDIATCQVKSYNQCVGTSKRKCFENFPKKEECLSDGAFLSEDSAVRFPLDVNVNALTTEEKQFVCTSALMEDEFKSLDDGRNKRYGIAYIGTSLGSFRAYPTFRQVDPETNECTDYDPRFRPWYVIATSGAKNVILIIDVSGSMSAGRIQIAKDAATAVVGTLSNSDFVGVISFNDAARSIYSNRIIRATSSDKESLIQKIDALEAGGKTNYEAAIKKAFSMLEAAEDDEYGAPCLNGQNVFLFLTDGTPTVGKDTSAELISLIDSYSTQATFFTYALGSGAQTEILKDLACQYKGIMFEIEDSASDSVLATTMKNYYSYISKGVSITEPVWTEPYIDAFGFGKMVTVSMPVYYEQSDIRTILGVAGIDILWEQIQFGFTEEEVIKKLISNVPCQRSNLTQCQIQELRDPNCGVSGCSSSGQIVTCSNTPGNIFTESVDPGSQICCGLTVGGLIGILIAILVIIGIIIGVLCYRYKKEQREREMRGEIEAENRDHPQPHSQKRINSNDPYYPPPYFKPENNPYRINE